MRSPFGVDFEQGDSEGDRCKCSEVLRTSILIAVGSLTMHSGVRATATGHVRHQDRISKILLDLAPLSSQ